VTVRPPLVHGPRQPLYREQFFWGRLRDGRPIILPDGGGTRMQWVYVTDVVELCLRVMAMAEPVGEPLYFGGFLDLFPISQTVEKARRLLGFTPTPLETALAAGHAWYLTQPRRPVDYAFEDRLIASA
jgi:nucleoside-diphosphate-sugar epimerase